MRLGAHADALAPSLDGADAVVFLHRPELAWDAGKVVGALRGDGACGGRCRCADRALA